ncbi:MAG TPA: hypothetical protein VJT15_10380 [Pyrinomonadaceae bacterium]|nr:hypothetical protein [Pyrinomonadaceae bacterium]
MFSIITDGQTLLFILALLYLTECFIWVKKQSVAFVSNSGKRWRVTTPKSWLGNANGGALMLNPLPPPGRVFLSHLLPISISPTGVCAFNSQTLSWGARSTTQTGEFVLFSAINKATADGAHLLFNGEKFTKCVTPKQAKALADLIGEVSAAKLSKREALLRAWLAKQFDTKQAVNVWRETEEAVGPIRWMCLLSFVFVFVALPVAVTIFGLERLIIPLAAAMVLLAVQTAVMFYRAHRKLFPRESQERFENVVKMILCPPVSLRAADVLTRNALSEFSPLVVANVLEGADEQRFVRAVVLDLEHPLLHEVTEQHAMETVNWMAAEQLRLTREHVQRAGLANLFGPTEREGESLSYCPRCSVQFVMTKGECPDCPGVALVSFSVTEEVRLSATSG